MRQRKTLRERIEARIARKRDDVFMPREFADLGGEDQVLRVLRGLVREGRLVPSRLWRLWPCNSTTAVRRADPVQPERLHRRGAPGAHQTRGAMGADRGRAGLQ
jgi:hypothetical protein